MSKKKLSMDKRKGLTESLFRTEIKTSSYFRCGGEYCPFLNFIDRAFNVLYKVRGGVYKNIQDKLLPAEIALPAEFEHQENVRTIHQQIFYNQFQSIGLSCNIPKSNVLEHYGLHETSKL